MINIFQQIYLDTNLNRHLAQKVRFASAETLMRTTVKSQTTEGWDQITGCCEVQLKLFFSRSYQDMRKKKRERGIGTDSICIKFLTPILTMPFIFHKFSGYVDKLSERWSKVLSHLLNTTKRLWPQRQSEYNPAGGDDVGRKAKIFGNGDSFSKGFP